MKTKNCFCFLFILSLIVSSLGGPVSQTSTNTSSYGYYDGYYNGYYNGYTHGYSASFAEYRKE